VKLLFDENLSRRLVLWLNDLFPGSIHVGSVGLLEAPDKKIWKFAREGGFCIVSADSDFYEMAVLLNAPPKVIWLQGCNYPSSIAENLIRSQSIRIVDFLNDDERSVLVLRPQS
jgi:predicted nuclease of predicted toxin-antitoxin system